MLKRYILALGKHSGHVFTLAGIAIALVWFIPPRLSRLDLHSEFPVTLLDQTLLSAAAAVVALLVGSYLAWADATRALDKHKAIAKEKTPAVILGEGFFFTGPDTFDSGWVDIPIQKIHNRYDHPLYLEPPSIYKWGLPTPLGKPGMLSLYQDYTERELPRSRKVERLVIAPHDLAFELNLSIEVQWEVDTAERLAPVLKNLRSGGSITLRFLFSPGIEEPVDRETHVDLDSFCYEVLDEWKKDKRTDLLRIYADS